MRWALNFNKKNKLRYIWFNFLLILANAAELIPAVLFGLVIDAIPSGNKTYMLILLGIIVLIAITRFLLYYCGVVKNESLTFKISKEIRIKCYEKLNMLDMDYYNNNNIGEVGTILTSDINNIKDFLEYAFHVSISIIITFLVTLIYGLTINWQVILCILIPVPIMAFLTTRYLKKVPTNYKESRDLLSTLNDRIQENIEGNKIVKNFGKAALEISKFRHDNKKLIAKNKQIQDNANIFFRIIGFLADNMATIMLFAGGVFFFLGEITLGQLVTINSVLWTLQWPFYEIGELIDVFEKFNDSTKRIKTLLSTNSKIKNTGTKKIKDIKTITLKNVTVKYDKNYGIKNLSLKIKKGQTVALIGEVGSGKSSVINLLLRFVDPSEGEVLINGINIKEYELKNLREIIGYVAQEPFLFSDTIKNNITFGNEILTDEEIDEVMKVASANYINKLPSGIDTIIGENGVTLSGGEKQRLTLARAIAVNPQILILDDITSALDTETELEVTKNINNLKYDCTKIIVAQKILSVKNADIICVFKDNEVVEMGTHKELLSLKGQYKELFDIQNSNVTRGVNNGR